MSTAKGIGISRVCAQEWQKSSKVVHNPLLSFFLLSFLRSPVSFLILLSLTDSVASPHYFLFSSITTIIIIYFVIKHITFAYSISLTGTTRLKSTYGSPR